MLSFIGETQDAVKTVMVRDERQKAALDTLKLMKKRTNARNKMVKRASKDMSTTLSIDAATDSDIDTVWDAYFAQRAAYNQDMLDLRYQLKDQLTREEWQQVFDVN